MNRFVFTCLCLAVPFASWGQSTFGSIVGNIQDPDQAAVPGANATARNLEENTMRQVVSAQDGSFQFQNLKPGHYALIVEKPGFADAKADSVQLDARQVVRVDLTLVLASVGQTVEVSAAAPIINTESGVLGDSKEFRQVVGLPINYRGATTSPLAAMSTVPGAQQDGQGNVSLGGAMPSQIQFSVDGVSTVNIRQNGALGNMNPSSELISEFRVTQFNNNAEFSQAGDVTITTKSGGNQVHGSVFEYLQNSVLDATPYGFDSKAHKAFNTFGGSLSGPVAIPHLYHGKDKTFFFVDYEGNRRSFATPQQFSVPTAAMRSGDLSGLPGPAVTGTLTGLPFPGNQVPAARLNGVGQKLLGSYIPLPNFGDGSDTNANYRQLTPTPGATNGYDLRFDHNISARQQIYGRWSWKNVDTTLANALLPPDRDHETNRNFLVSHSFAIRPNLLNEARFGISYYSLTVNFPIQGAAAISQLGLQGLDLSDHPTTNAFPTFNFTDGTGFTPIGRDKTGVTKSQTLQFADNLSWVKGKHTAKFGIDLRRVFYQDLESFGGSDDFGAFTFASGTFTGNAFGDLLLGLPATTYVAQSGPDVYARAFQTGLYAQDEWHTTSLGQLSFNTTNIDVGVVRTTANSVLANGEPAYQFPQARTADNPLSVAGTADFYQNVNLHYRDPQSAQWNFTVEREIGSELAVKVSYLGMHTYRLPITVDLNQVRPSAQPYDPNLRPYLNWGRILSSENYGFASYNALQTELSKRFSHGLLFQASYVWAKNLSDASGDAAGAFTPEVIYGTPIADRFNLRDERGNIAGTRRNRALLSAIYQLPIGKNRHFLHQMNGFADAILGGWEVSTVTMWQTGPFLTPITSPSFDPANLNQVYRGAALRPDRIGNGNIANPTPNAYFDIKAFTQTPANAGRIGNSGVGILSGPGTLAMAAGLAKTFQPRERMRLRFEATFTNLPNHPNFAPPSVDVSAPATFGKITSVQSAENSGNRVGQVALRLDF